MGEEKQNMIKTKIWKMGRRNKNIGEERESKKKEYWKKRKSRREKRVKIREREGWEEVMKKKVRVIEKRERNRGRKKGRGGL